ncbi:hypothetical protein HI795_14255 [Ralstonia solanacearum]|nr:hypothetical protein HI816_14255 [Ralstonia solanacearum]QKM24178.1 hypothetical protein HI796_14250 [Ralstonia solanacearum]QKM28986.1 hypothetical protein HI795_14255 [Ralstonia solanacearum]
MNIYFDNNTLAEMVRAGVNPIAALASSKYVVSVTPDLASEYQQAIASERVSAAEKDLCHQLLAAATERGIFGFDEAGRGYSGFDFGVWASDGMTETLRSIKITDRPGKVIPKNRTDAFLVALAEGAVVITNDTGRHFRQARSAGQHVYSWSEISSESAAPSEVARQIRALLFR